VSQLRLTSRYAGTFYMNVTSFQSPIFQSIVGVQTKTMHHWFPIKTNQPEIQFSVQFANEHDYEKFQQYVRNSQVASLVQSEQPWVTLWWPERSIQNWTGFIKEFQCGGERFDPAPKASFTVELVESMVSQRAVLSSVGADFWNLLGVELPWVDKILQQPVPPSSQARGSDEAAPTSRPPGQGGGGMGGGGSW